MRCTPQMKEGHRTPIHRLIDTIMRALLLAAIAWSACDALLLGPAYATQRASAYRAHVRLDEGGAAAPTAAPSTFTADEIAALKEASVSKDTPAKDSLGPEALLNAFTQPKEYFSLLRNPNKDPPKEVWDPLREKWPILAGKTDEELLEALKPIKAEYVDARFL